MLRDGLSGSWWSNGPATYEGEGRGGAGNVTITENANYGAIAVSEESFAWGSSTGYADAAKAKREAIRRCAESGAGDCAAKSWGNQFCLALAVSPRIVDVQRGAWGTGRDETIDGAKSRALENCGRHAKDCALVESFCAR